MLKTILHSCYMPVVGATVGLALAASYAFAADQQPEIVVEATAPVHSAPTGQGAPGGATIDMLSVRYHVHLGNLDLTKHADVVALEGQIKAAAAKGCKEIHEQYPLRPMSDEDACVSMAVKNAMVSVQAAIAAAEKKAGK